MSYRTPLETRVAKKVTRAIIEHRLIDDGDRIMVGLSGGKDSWALLQVLDVLRQRAPIDFSLVAVNVNSGYEGFRHDEITTACAARGWECHIEHTTIGATMDDILDDGDTPCSLCARLRRGVLYRLAAAHGATKIALGHHLDDFIETALLNFFFQGSLKAMPARLVSDNGQHVVIRPLVYVTEAEARTYTQESGLPVIGCCCSACGDLSLKRQRIKRLIAELEVEHPDIKQSMIGALGKVVPSHLLDASVAGAARREAAPAPAGAVEPAARVATTVRAVLQRVSRASVSVDDVVVGAIGPGLVALVGVAAGDGPADVEYLASKIASMRVFDDDDGRLNRSVVDIGGQVLIVSQFTLLGDLRTGRRPAFDLAAPPDEALGLYEALGDRLQALGVPVATGRFRATMRVDLVNEGPVTLLVDSRRAF